MCYVGVGGTLDVIYFVEFELGPVWTRTASLVKMDSISQMEEFVRKSNLTLDGFVVSLSADLHNKTKILQAEEKALKTTEAKLR